jgi:hypothetical protein
MLSVDLVDSLASDCGNSETPGQECLADLECFRGCGNASRRGYPLHDGVEGDASGRSLQAPFVGFTRTRVADIAVLSSVLIRWVVDQVRFS